MALAASRTIIAGPGPARCGAMASRRSRPAAGRGRATAGDLRAARDASRISVAVLTARILVGDDDELRSPAMAHERPLCRGLALAGQPEPAMSPPPRAPRRARAGRARLDDAGLCVVDDDPDGWPRCSIRPGTPSGPRALPGSPPHRALPPRRRDHGSALWTLNRPASRSVRLAAPDGRIGDSRAVGVLFDAWHEHRQRGRCRGQDPRAGFLGHATKRLPRVIQVDDAGPWPAAVGRLGDSRARPGAGAQGSLASRAPRSCRGTRDCSWVTFVRIATSYAMDPTRSVRAVGGALDDRYCVAGRDRARARELRRRLWRRDVGLVVLLDAADARRGRADHPRPPAASSGPLRGTRSWSCRPFP